MLKRSRSLAMTMALAAILAPATLQADEVSGDGVPSAAEMWRIIQQQQSEIRDLREKLEATGDAIEEVQGIRTGTGADDPAGAAEVANSVYATGPDRARSSATSTGRRWWERTTIGSYGELHYNNLKDRNNYNRSKKVVDFHRFVLFVGHEFTDKIRVFTELEVEHALVFGGEDSHGEVEIEQAWLEWDIFDDYSAKGGLFLVPVGILNETHEPNTFYGVERNPVEKNVIPSTWWEAGIGATSRWAYGISGDLNLTTGLATHDFNIRGGRQKVSKADGSHGAVTARLAWRGLPGLEIAATGQYQTNLNAIGQKTPASLFETHIIYHRGWFGVRALYSQWNLFSNAADVDGKDKQYGFYIEPSIKPYEWIGIFGRFNQWDNAAGDQRTQNNKYRQYDLGINFWPIPNVVIKFDYQWQDAPDDEKEFDGFNLGIGYSF